MKKLYIILMIFALSSCSQSYSDSSSQNGGNSSGKGGSMARFCISGDYLYTVDNDSLKLFNISEPENPVYQKQRTIYLGWGIETIFPMDTLLFIGSQTGMQIFDISDNRFPYHLSTTVHVTSCDPVVAQGNYAYVTLNSASIRCGRQSNLLQVYNISNPRYPEHLKDIQCVSPRGLGVDGEKLFVCDNGLKVFDISNPSLPRQIDDVEPTQATLTNPYDVIPVNGVLLLTAANGIFQFDYTGNKLRLLSQIPVNRKN